MKEEQSAFGAGQVKLLRVLTPTSLCSWALELYLCPSPVLGCDGHSWWRVAKGAFRVLSQSLALMERIKATCLYMLVLNKVTGRPLQFLLCCKCILKIVFPAFTPGRIRPVVHCFSFLCGADSDSWSRDEKLPWWRIPYSHDGSWLCAQLRAVRG